MTIMDNFIRVLSTTRASMLPLCSPLHIPAHKQRDPKALPGQFRVPRLAQRYPEPEPIDPVEPDMQDASWT